MATTQPREHLFEEKQRKLIAEIEKRHGKTVDQLREERGKRVEDAIELRVPDRVPVVVSTGGFAAKYVGLPLSAMYYNHAAYREACKKVLLDFEPDVAQAAVAANSGLVLELLNSKYQRWPGGNLPDDASYQYVEGEYMKEEEYSLLLKDSSNFIMRYYLPRVYGTLEPLSKLPPFWNMVNRPAGTGLVALLGILGRPEFQELAGKLQKAVQEQEKVRKEGTEFAEEMALLGFRSPQQPGIGVGQVPFDTVSDYFRGMRGAMLDMYHCPEKLRTACEMILEWGMVQAMPANPKMGRLPSVGATLHRGSDGFMSLKQFERFYWPDLKKIILTNVELGYIATPFFEGIWNQRLEYLLELPKGKVVFHCDSTDVFKAKEVLCGHMCIQGGVPITMLAVGSPQDVDEYCKKLIKVVGKGGGFIMAPSGGGFEVAKPANVKAMVDSVKKYSP